MPSPASPEDSRTRILRATLRLVSEGGVGNVTNRNVARESGVSLGSLTYHFDSQATLLRESLELFIAEESERLAALRDQVDGARLTADQAALALQALLEQDRGRRIAKFALYLEAAREPQLRDAALRCFDAYDELAASSLRAFGVQDAEQVAPIMVAIVDGLQLRRLASGEADLRLAEPLGLLLRGLSSAATG